MSVARAREFIKRCKAAGIKVHEQPGWEKRGNGQTSAYEGWINHHTATNFANQNLSVLVNGRSDLKGPLCNSCGWADGSIGIIAAHPANHAGASGGWDTSPFPKTSLFNKRVWGHEIIYPGTEPMTAAQYKTMLIVSKIGVDIWGYGDVNRIKNHDGTSITGKWDPGYAPGKTYDVKKIRREVIDLGKVKTPKPPVKKKEDEMAVQAWSYGPTRNEKGELITRTHTVVCPVGKVSQLTAKAWMSVKSANGPMEYVRIMSIASNKPYYFGPKGEVSKKNVPADKERVWFEALDGTDQFTVYVKSAHPYSLCLETKAK